MFDRQGNPATASREAITMAAKVNTLRSFVTLFDLLG